MGTEQPKPAGPDLALGIPVDNLPDGHMLAGHVGDDAVLLAHHGDEFFAIGASCSHYGGPLAEGLMVGDTVRCPWHHACFSLRTGEPLHPPALSPVACWAVEPRDGKLFVTIKKEAPARQKRSSAAPAAGMPERIVIIGGGAAGFAAAEKLRREQYQGSIVMLSNDDAPPVDRPNLSKDYLAGNAPEEWVPLRPASFYSDNGIELRLEANVTGIDARLREVALAGGDKIRYDRLLLATGAEPVRLSIPGADLPHVRTLRSLADCRAIIARAASRRAVTLRSVLIAKGSSSRVTTCLRGLSEANGFWNTICTCGRSRLSVARSASATSSPFSRSSPDVGRSIMVTCRASVDLPQPDSPTIANVSPSRTLKDTPSSARTRPLGRNGPRETV